MKPSELTALFDTWFEREYYNIRERLSLTGAFDEDAFHDAYITARRAVRACKEDKPNIAAVFQKEYRHISKRHISEQFALCNPDDLFFDRLTDEDTESLSQAKETHDAQALALSITNYVKDNYPRVWVLMWYDRNVHGRSFNDIHDITGVSYIKARDGIAAMNADIRQRYAYAI